MALFSSNLPKDTYQPETLNRNAAQKILMITADGTEDLEFFYPYYRFIEAGFAVDVATPDGGVFKGKQGLGLKESLKIGAVKSNDYALLYIPGGKAPAQLVKNDATIALTKQFYDNGKPIAAVCHGPQLLAAADIISGRNIAAWPDVESEVTDAGAVYVNSETVIDGPFITARWPGDLPSHLKQTLAVLSKSAKMPSQAHAA